MPNLETGDMWTAWDSADLFLITTNAVVKQNGQLVMGRGMALEARNRDSQIPLYFGRALAGILSKKGYLGKIGYGIIIPDMWPHRKEGMFQTKDHYRDDASRGLIIMSTSMLFAWCKKFPATQVHLNYPGIGNGGLDRKEVRQIVAMLPDTVTIWSKE